MDTHLDELSLTVKNKIKDIYESYDYSDTLMADTIKGAMSWVPLYMSGISKPTNDQLTLLASQVLAIVLANNMAKVKKTGNKKEQKPVPQVLQVPNENI